MTLTEMTLPKVSSDADGRHASRQETGQFETKYMRLFTNSSIPNGPSSRP